MAEFRGHVPVGRGPDILGMGRDRPAGADHPAGIAGDRGGGVQEMHMQPAAIGGPFGGQHRRLTETADAVAAGVAQEIAQKHPRRLPETPRPGGADQPAQHAQGLVMQIFGQIGDRGLDLVMDGMAAGIGRVPHRDQMQRQPGLFQPAQFLRDKGLRQARIAFQQHGDAARGHQTATAPATRLGSSQSPTMRMILSSPSRSGCG